jgi:hypothetical protein
MKNKDELLIERNGDGIKPNKALQETIIEAQFKTAINGNAEMLKWLGQQYLNQSPNKQPLTDEECPLVFCYGEGTDCPVHQYLKHIGEFGTPRYKEFMKENKEKENL